MRAVKSRLWRIGTVALVIAAALTATAAWLPQEPFTALTVRQPSFLSNRLGRHLGDGSVPNGLGVNVHFTRERPPQLAQIRAAGFRIVRTDLLWAEVEITPGAYDWRRSDELVTGLREAGLVPLFILAYSNPLYAPRLHGRPDTPSLAYAAPEYGAPRAAFMAFASAAARRYGGAVIWEVWNEPDHNFGQPPNLKSYVDFAIDACSRIHAAAPDAAIIGPAASGFVWGLLRDLTTADRAGCFDAISVHPYRDEAPESVLKDWPAMGSELTRSGRGAGPALVSSEWGYSSVAGVLSPQRQAELVVRSYFLNIMAGIPMSVIYDWQDDGPAPNDKEANFGLIDFSGKPKPVFHLISEITRELAGLHYLGRVETRASADIVLAFGKNGVRQKYIGWSTSGRYPFLESPGIGTSLSQRPAIISASESISSYRASNTAVPVQHEAFTHSN